MPVEISTLALRPSAFGRRLAPDEENTTIGNSNFNLEFFLWGNFNFLLLMMGMKSSTSNNACIWCKINKPNRWKMDFDLHHYNTASLRRTHQEIKAMENTKGTQDRYSCENTPLLDIDLDYIILDELHLLLRILDVLISNIVNEVIQWDMKEDLKRNICILSITWGVF